MPSYRGTVGGFETSKGAAGVAARGDDHSGYVVKGKHGNVYAGKDGEVYRRERGGGWETREDGKGSA